MYSFLHLLQQKHQGGKLWYNSVIIWSYLKKLRTKYPAQLSSWPFLTDPPNSTTKPIGLRTRHTYTPPKIILPARSQFLLIQKTKKRHRNVKMRCRRKCNATAAAAAAAHTSTISSFLVTRGSTRITYQGVA